MPDVKDISNIFHNIVVHYQQVYTKDLPFYNTHISMKPPRLFHTFSKKLIWSWGNLNFPHVAPFPHPHVLDVAARVVRDC